MSRLEDFRSTLTVKHHNYTNARSLLFKQLLNQGPLSAGEIVNLCHDINRATTYRNLLLFEQLGIVKRIWIGFKSKYELSDRFSPHHHHLLCVKCKLTVTIEDQTLEKLIQNLSTKVGIKPLDHYVEITGLCQNCQQSYRNRH